VKRVVEEQFPEKAPIPIDVTTSDDPRSYHINSDKLTSALGFQATRTVEEAIGDLCAAFKAGKLPNSFDDNRYFNVRTMKAAGAR
jgi:hypothetical protein